MFQSCLTLWDPMDQSPSGSFVHGILQARIWEWVVMPSSRGYFQPRDSLLHWQAGSLPLVPPEKPSWIRCSPYLFTVPMKRHHLSHIRVLLDEKPPGINSVSFHLALSLVVWHKVHYFLWISVFSTIKRALCFLHLKKWVWGTRVIFKSSIVFDFPGGVENKSLPANADDRG